MRTTSCSVGAGTYRWRQRERSVCEKSCGSADGAHMMITVCSGGSSTVFSNASAASVFNRSAFSMTMTRQVATVGRRAACGTIVRRT